MRDAVLGHLDRDRAGQAHRAIASFTQRATERLSTSRSITSLDTAISAWPGGSKECEDAISQVADDHMHFRSGSRTGAPGGVRRRDPGPGVELDSGQPGNTSCSAEGDGRLSADSDG